MWSLTYESSGSKIIKLSYVSRKTCTFEIIFFKILFQTPVCLNVRNQLKLINHLYALVTFRESLILISVKANLLYLLYFMPLRSCLLHLKRQSSLLKSFLRTRFISKNSYLDDYDMILPAFHSKTNQKLHDIPTTCKLKGCKIKGYIYNSSFFRKRNLLEKFEKCFLFHKKSSFCFQFCVILFLPPQLFPFNIEVKK